MKQKLIAVLTSVLYLLMIFPAGITVAADTTGTTANGLKYTIADGEAIITEYADDIPADVIIPESIEGYPVTTIGSYAFGYCNHLCTVHIPDSVTIIEKFAFFHNPSLTVVEIGKNVTEIGAKAFLDCPSLSEITLPASTISLGKYVFLECYALSAINVEADNPQYSSKDGVLFNKDQTTIIQFPAGKSGEYVVPNGVTTIAESAFYDCDSITAITIGNHVNSSIRDWTFYCCDALTTAIIGNNVTRIDTFAFYGCPQLTTITIGARVTSIMRSAFENCPSLVSITILNRTVNITEGSFSRCPQITDVYYVGSEEDRTNMSISEYTGSLLSATWHYNYKPEPTAAPGDINEDGKVNIRDLGLLQQYLNGWDVTVDIFLADINHDEKVNIRDLGLLQQHLNGWNVEGL